MPNGLLFRANFLTPDEEKRLWDFVYSRDWDETMRRRVQHYGQRYVYANVKTNNTTPVPPVPDLFLDLAYRALRELNLPAIAPDDRWQVIVNEYKPSQKISPHIDDRTQFGPIILCCSLGATVDIIFRNRNAKPFVQSVPARSLYVMTGDSRYRWTHELANSSNDTRISITFRTIIN